MRCLLGDPLRPRESAHLLPATESTSILLPRESDVVVGCGQRYQCRMVPLCSGVLRGCRRRNWWSCRLGASKLLTSCRIANMATGGSQTHTHHPQYAST